MRARKGWESECGNLGNAFVLANYVATVLAFSHDMAPFTPVCARMLCRLNQQFCATLSPSSKGKEARARYARRHICHMCPRLLLRKFVAGERRQEWWRLLRWSQFWGRQTRRKRQLQGKRQGCQASRLCRRFNGRAKGSKEATVRVSLPRLSLFIFTSCGACLLQARQRRVLQVRR